MHHKPLQQHILRLITGTLLVLALAIMLAVWLSTYAHVQDQVQRDLNVGREVLQQLLNTREQQLLNSAEVLTADFGFKQAVATMDSATMESALQNHGARIKADLMAIVSLQGLIVASTTDTQQENSRFAHQNMLTSALEQGGMTGFIQVAQELYQVIVLPVRAPIPVGLAVIGFRLNADLAQELKKVTNLDVSFVAERKDSNGVQISTLVDDQLTLALAQQQDTWHWRLPFTRKAHYVTQAMPLSESQRITVYLTTSIDDAFANFDVLQLEIAFITLVAALLALVGGILFARKLTRPMQMLATMANDIANGHYRRDVQVTRNIIEVGQLMAAFNRMQEDISEREARIIYQAHHDPLTGLINRQHAITLLDDALRLQRTMALRVIVLNVLDFRTVNDTFGHLVGDACLRKISERLQSLQGEFLLAARLVGDEFLLVASAADLSPEQLQAHLQHTFAVQEVEVTLRFAFGVASYPGDANNASALIQKASIALDVARREKLGIAFYERKVEELHLKRLTLLADLKQALHANDGQLRMYYQPKVCARTLSAQRFEALIRWIHPEHGFVPPDMFIPLAEQAGLINGLTDWIVETVILQIAQWQHQHFSAQVAVNLSAQDLSRHHLLDHINDLLLRHRVDNAAVSFEITESELMREPKQAIALLNRFRDQGFKLAIDDFGTGYSSLSQLKNMPVTELKIDRSFVMQLDQAQDDQIIVRSTIDLAHSFDLEIVAEGVENPAALALLQKWGVDWIQGYYFSRPLPANDVLPWVHNFTQQQRELAQK